MYEYLRRGRSCLGRTLTGPLQTVPGVVGRGVGGGSSVVSSVCRRVFSTGGRFAGGGRRACWCVAQVRSSGRYRVWLGGVLVVGLLWSRGCVVEFSVPGGVLLGVVGVFVGVLVGCVSSFPSPARSQDLRRNTDNGQRITDNRLPASGFWLLTPPAYAPPACPNSMFLSLVAVRVGRLRRTGLLVPGDRWCLSRRRSTRGRRPVAMASLLVQFMSCWRWVLTSMCPSFTGLVGCAPTPEKSRWSSTGPTIRSTQTGAG